MPSQRAGFSVPPLGTTYSGPPANAGAMQAQATIAARPPRQARRANKLALRIGDAPLLDPITLHRAVQELAERLLVHRSFPGVEHLLLRAVEERAVDVHGGEESRVVVRVHDRAAADTHLSVAQADGGLQAGELRLRVQEYDRRL